jgi:hypothetical protein
MDLKALLAEAQSEPTGVVARSADGSMFFIPHTETSRLSIPSSGLYAAYLASAGGGPSPVAQANDACSQAKRWLDSHSPDSARWRRVCLTYFEVCV